MNQLQPLTDEERKMAEQYIDQVDQFLRRKRLDPAEYYYVVIFGYLSAIQRECRNPNPPENKNIYGLIEVCIDRHGTGGFYGVAASRPGYAKVRPQELEPGLHFGAHG